MNVDSVIKQKRKIKFPLILKDNAKVRTLKDLQDNFDMDEILHYYINGQLEIWLEDRYEDEILEQVHKLDSNKSDWVKQLCVILGVDEDYAKNAPPIQEVKYAIEKRKKVYQLTDDRTIRLNVKKAAFTQAELDSILKGESDIVYLTKGDYTVLPNCQNIHVKGIGDGREIQIKWNGHRKFEYDKANITFENVCLTEWEKRYNRLEKFTSDSDILKHSEETAFSQEELNILIKFGIDQVYLCGEEGKSFKLHSYFENITIIGINNPKMDLKNEDVTFFANKKVVFKNIILPDVINWDKYKPGYKFKFGQWCNNKLTWTVLDIDKISGDVLFLCDSVVQTGFQKYLTSKDISDKLKYFEIKAFSKEELDCIDTLFILTEKEIKKYLKNISNTKEMFVFSDTPNTYKYCDGRQICYNSFLERRSLGIRPAIWANPNK